jgi:hypothetical protein
VVCCELAACTNDADQAEYEGEDPAGTATEAMATADDERNDQGGKVDEEFENRNTTSWVELHFEELDMVCFDGL